MRRAAERCRRGHLRRLRYHATSATAAASAPSLRPPPEARPRDQAHLRHRPRRLRAHQQESLRGARRVPKAPPQPPYATWKRTGRARRASSTASRGSARSTTCCAHAACDIVAVCHAVGPASGAGHPRRPGRQARPRARSRWPPRSPAADELVEACDAAGVQLFVVKQNRLNPTVQLVRRAIDKGRFGRIYMANCTVRWTRPQEYYDAAPWRGTWEFDGGAFMNQACHYVDLAPLAGRPGRERGRQDRHAGAAHRGRGLGRRRAQFRSGALGLIDVTMLTYPRTSRARSRSWARRARSRSAARR